MLGVWPRPSSCFINGMRMLHEKRYFLLPRWLGQKPRRRYSVGVSPIGTYRPGSSGAISLTAWIMTLHFCDTLIKTNLGVCLDD